MIRYALCCDEGHRFESWFYDSSAFEEQAQRGLVTCPACHSRHVVKAIMAPAIGGRRRPAADPLPDAGSDAPDQAAAVEVALLDDGRRELVRAFRARVLAGTRDVGRSFAAEARRVHEGEASPDRIRGQATLEEARELLEDGIMVLPLPTLPDDLN